jgi:hypothetical protein
MTISKIKSMPLKHNENVLKQIVIITRNGEFGLHALFNWPNSYKSRGRWLKTGISIT